jgi:hypothetical protein
MFTRKQYLDGECSHDTYYAQFVTDRVINHVLTYIGADTIRTSHDPHMNDILLHRWDRLIGIKDCIDTKLFKACNNVTYAEDCRDKFLWSLSDQVCIAKAAAKVWKARDAAKVEA